MQLVSADPLFAAGHQIDGLQHQVERDAAMLENGADLHGELALAMTALLEAHANALRRVGLDVRDAVNGSTMRARRAFGPDHAFEIIESRRFIVKVGGRKDRHGSLR